MGIKIRRYKGATIGKIKNRRVGAEWHKGAIGLSFKTLCLTDSDLTPSAHHEIKRGKVKITNILISPEAAQALMISIASTMGWGMITDDNSSLLSIVAPVPE